MSRSKEPPRKEDKLETSYSAKAPLPAIAITYLAPSVRSKDAPALSLAEEILSGGASSRLYQAMVYEQQVAQAVSCSADLHEDLGLLVFRAVLASGKPVEVAKKSLTEQIENRAQERRDGGGTRQGEEPRAHVKTAGTRDGQRQGERARRSRGDLWRCQRG